MDTNTEKPSLADIVARAQNSSATDPTWRTDYRQAPRRHYFTDDECGGVRGAVNTLATSADEVNCGECIGMMYDQGVLEAPRDN